MKKFNRLIIVLLFILILVGCTNENTIQNYNVYINILGDIEEVEVTSGTYAYDLLVEPEDEELKFNGWFLNEECTEPLKKDHTITSDTYIYAKFYKEQLNVIFYCDGEAVKVSAVDNGTIYTDIPSVNKQGYEFLGWSTKKTHGKLFDFTTPITKDVILYAQFSITQFTITYNLGYESFLTKNDLYVSYFTDFYNFLVANTTCDLEKYEIHNIDEFLDYCKTWNANGRNEMAGLGDAFGQYYLLPQAGTTIDEQPTTHFIGYCYQNGKYLEFLDHLMIFFAYWRTDEGYTGGKDDPNNLGNDFFASAWASFVDTCKFFYFTSKTLNTKYSWFNSERVKVALDIVPSVIENTLKTNGDYFNSITLISITRKGYQFLGWYDEEGNNVSVVNQTMNVYAKWEKL